MKGAACAICPSPGVVQREITNDGDRFSLLLCAECAEMLDSGSVN